MAQDFSSQFLAELRFPNLPGLHARIRARRFIRTVRWIERNLRPGTLASTNGSRRPDRPAVTRALEDGAAALRTEGWAFFENVLDEELHAELLAGWPRRCYLTPAASLVKSWDRGFGWRRGQKDDPAYLDRHPALRWFLDDLRSAGFGRRFSAVAGEEDLSCFSFVVTTSFAGSVVAPHRDDWAFLENGPRAAYNLVFFIDGSGGPGSGGLSILGSNSFDQVIFESLNLRNTALVYDAKAPFYHGFKPVERGKFRWAIISNFVSSDYPR